MGLRARLLRKNRGTLRAGRFFCQDLAFRVMTQKAAGQLVRRGRRAGAENREDPNPRIGSIFREIPSSSSIEDRRGGRIEIPDSPQEGRDGSAGGLALPFRRSCLRKIRSVAKRGRVPPPAAPRPRLESKMLRGRRMFLDRGWTPPRLTRGFEEGPPPLTHPKDFVMIRHSL